MRTGVAVLGITLLASAGVFTALATFEPGDMKHVLATADDGGGRVAHGVHFEPGRARYSVLITGRGLLARRTDLRIVLEGSDPPAWEVRSGLPPAVDLGVSRWPRFTGRRLVGFEPGDKFRLWVILKPRPDAFAGARQRPRTYALALYAREGHRVLEVPIQFGGRSHGRALEGPGGGGRRPWRRGG